MLTTEHVLEGQRFVETGLSGDYDVYFLWLDVISRTYMKPILGMFLRREKEMK